MTASRIRPSTLLVAAALACSPCAAFQASSLVPKPGCHQKSAAAAATPAFPLSAEVSPTGGDSPSNLDDTNGPEISRRGIVRSTAASLAAAAALLVGLPSAALADIEGVVTPTISDVPPVKIDSLEAGEDSGVTMYKTKSGLKYIELQEGTGPSPRYGQLVSIAYKAYVKLPEIKGKPSKLEEFDSDSGYLVKHGNGRNVPGLDEGLHTMKAGGRRRIIVPAKLGYVQSGLGPIPESPIGRFKLNRLLDKMIEVKGGNVVFDVTMRSTMDDEADQGYYEDGSLSPEDFEKLRKNLQQAGIDARASSFKGAQGDDA